MGVERSSLEEQSMFFTAKPFLHTLYLAFVVVLFFLNNNFYFFYYCMCVSILSVSVHHVDTGGQKVSDLPRNRRYRWF